MKTRIITAWMGALGLLAAGFMGVSASAKPPEKADSEQVTKLLSEARTMAFQLRDDAAYMETFTVTNAGWQTHVNAIGQIKDHSNALALQVDKLKAARTEASPWQQTVIDRIDPLLDEMSGYTAAVIERLTNDPERINAPDYKDYLEANADYSSDLATMIANFVDYGRAKERMESLATKLEIPTR
jgi:hypothetical protein